MFFLGVIKNMNSDFGGRHRKIDFIPIFYRKRQYGGPVGIRFFFLGGGGEETPIEILAKKIVKIAPKMAEIGKKKICEIGKKIRLEII